MAIGFFAGGLIVGLDCRRVKVALLRGLLVAGLIVGLTFMVDLIRRHALGQILTLGVEGLWLLAGIAAVLAGGLGAIVGIRRTLPKARQEGIGPGPTRRCSRPIGRPLPAQEEDVLRRRVRVKMRNPRAKRASAPITMAMMSAPVKARPEEAAAAEPGAVAAKLDGHVVVKRVVATLVPPAGFFPLATNELTAPQVVATAGPPLREMFPLVSVKVSTKMPEPGAVAIE